MRLQSTYGIRPTLYGNSVAIGTFLTIYKNDIAPSGCFDCLGQELNRVDYAEVYTKFGTHFGEGDGSTTFNLPNFAQTDDTKTVVKVKNVDIGSCVNADTLGGKLASAFALKGIKLADYGIADAYTAVQSDAKYAPIANPMFTGGSTVNSTGAYYGLLNSNTRWRITNEGDSLNFINSAIDGSGANTYMFLKWNGNVGIGVTSPQATLHSTGSTILGANADGIGDVMGNKQILPDIDNASGKLIFYGKDRNGVARRYELTSVI